MTDREVTEYVELGSEREWAYLKRFYQVAAGFYQVHDRVVSEQEIAECIQRFKEKPAPRIRKQEKLQDWRFALDEQDEGLKEGYFSFGYDDTAWEAVRIPHSVNHVPEDPVRYGSTLYRFLAPEAGQRWDIWKGDYSAWYRQRIRVGNLEGRVVYLSFESVNLAADVWVNEMPVAIGHLGLFPFTMEVTEEMGWGEGEEAVIAVRACNTASNTPYLFSNGFQVAYARSPYLDRVAANPDWYDQSWAGIAGDAKLVFVDKNHIVDAFIRTQDIAKGKTRLTCRVELRNATWEAFSGNVRIEVSKWFPEEGKLELLASSPATVLPMSDAVVELAFEVANPDLWDVDHPHLYLARVVLANAAGQDIDDVCETFGIRTIQMVGSHFHLNGKVIVPRGTHDLANYFNDSLICPSDHSIVMDILLHKKMGATCSRWPSDIRMHYPRIAEYADQLGFMLSWTGYFEVWTVHPDMEMMARRDARAMVRSLRNRPSIIMWEMGDEPLAIIHPHRRLAWYELIYRLVEAEDTSRPIIPAGAWSNDLVDRIRDEDMSMAMSTSATSRSAEKRERALEAFPVFGLPLAAWDIHYVPYLPNDRRLTYQEVRRMRDALQGERPTILTEFGIDGMPNFENVRSIYGEPRWAMPGIMPVDRTARDLKNYGRPVTPEDWRETQAAQALVLSNIIGHLREMPEAFAGFYFPTLVDVWTFYFGVVDAAFNAKLSWFVVRGCYAVLYVTGLHGSAKHRRRDPIEITASNLGEARSGVALYVAVRDPEDCIVAERDIDGITIAGDTRVTALGELDVSALPPGLYSIEYHLTSDKNEPLAARIELFYLIADEYIE
jgi:hypothetical protein